MTYTIRTENEMPDFFEALKSFVDGWKGVKVETTRGTLHEVTEKLNEVYTKVPVAEQTFACGAALEVVRETTKNDAW